MVLSTLGVAADVTPSVVETFFSHASHFPSLITYPLRSFQLTHLPSSSIANLYGTNPQPTSPTTRVFV